VAEAAVFLLLPSASLCCFLPLFFVLSVNKVSSSFFVDGGSRWGRRKDRWWFAEGAADSRLLLWFFFSPASTPPLVFFLSVLFCFSSPSLVLLALAALMVAEWRRWMVVAEGHDGEEAQRRCPGDEEWSFFFSVQ
jgi:hypothetical protein